MYIAFKWLLSLTLGMWVAMCSLDILIKKNTYHEIADGDFYITQLKLNTLENLTEPVNAKLNFNTRRLIQQFRSKQTGVSYIHFVMFIAGALAVALYKRLNDIIFITKQKISNHFNVANAKSLLEYSKITATDAYKIATILYKYLMENLKILAEYTIISFYAFRLKTIQKPRVNILLINKIKQLGEERRHLGQLLLAALRENKSIRMQYQLETMAKNRLLRHIESTQKIMKDNRTKYISFQQLYLVTHQENVFLKSRLMKLTKEKEEASKCLLELMNAVYKSKNNELKEYCSRFIVKTKDNLLNADVGAEIQTFLRRRSRSSPGSASKWQLNDISDIATNSWLRLSKCTQITDTDAGDRQSLTPMVDESPKLRGLPGEYVWTVKDKHGLIEKLYEYDGESDFENGDTIRRIREYSVYFDKDCLLDFTNSTTVINNRSTQFGMQCSTAILNCRPATQRFLTGSEAFQKFMQNNRNLVSTSLVPISQSSQ